MFSCACENKQVIGDYDHTWQTTKNENKKLIFFALFSVKIFKNKKQYDNLIIN